MKICSKCNKEKELTEFYKSKDGKFGVRSKCKDCCRYYAKNHDNKEYMNLWREKNKEKLKQDNKNRYANNQEELKAYRKKYYQENKPQILEYQKQYYKNTKL